MNTQLLWAYEEYCTDCYAEGETPKGFERWFAELLTEGE